MGKRKKKKRETHHSASQTKRIHLLAAFDAFSDPHYDDYSIGQFHRERCISSSDIPRMRKSEVISSGPQTKFRVSKSSLERAVKSAKSSGGKLISRRRHGGHRSPLTSGEERTVVQKLQAMETEKGSIDRDDVRAVAAQIRFERAYNAMIRQELSPKALDRVVVR